MLAPSDLAAAAQLACLLEASAPKPGNVSPGRVFADTTYEDFLASAAAIGSPLGTAGSRALGETIRLAVLATRRWTNANTNLGIVLLLAPLARAAARASPPDGLPAESGLSHANLRNALTRVLAATTIDDTRATYAAIRLASPGGLGTAETEDVANEPTVTLVEAMRLASHRDAIASEYVTDFQATFEVGAPALEGARYAGLGWSDAVVETYLALLATQIDTHIERRAGTILARGVSRQARAVLDLGGVRSASGRAAITQFDTALRDEYNSANPGTTADITAAAIFVVLLGGGWQSRNGGIDAAAR